MQRVADANQRQHGRANENSGSDFADYGGYPDAVGHLGSQFGYDQNDGDIEQDSAHVYGAARASEYDIKHSVTLEPECHGFVSPV
jgi:hypothetical protein